MILNRFSLFRLRPEFAVCLTILPGTLAPAAEPTLEFLPREAAQAAIVDETIEAYFSRLQPVEMAAKTGGRFQEESPDAMREACRDRYRRAAGSFSLNEQKLVRFYLNEIHQAVEKDYPQLAALPWRLIHSSNSIEGGVATSRGSCLILTDRTLQKMAMGLKKGDPDQRRWYQWSIGRLAHEQFHVLQRLKPERFRNLYESWGFMRARQIDSTPWLVRQQYLNPDATDWSWIMRVEENGQTRWIWPRLILPTTTALHKVPADLQPVAVELDALGEGRFAVKKEYQDEPKMEELRKLAAYMNRFPLADLPDHPNELSAFLFGQMLLMDRFGLAPTLKRAELEKLETAARPLRDWAKTTLAAPR